MKKLLLLFTSCSLFCSIASAGQIAANFPDSSSLIITADASAQICATGENCLVLRDLKILSRINRQSAKVVVDGQWSIEQRFLVANELCRSFNLKDAIGTHYEDLAEQDKQIIGLSVSTHLTLIDRLNLAVPKLVEHITCVF